MLKWAEAECVRQTLQASPDNKRAVLGRVLGQIRFPLMSVEEFAQGPAQSAILTDRECVSLFLHFTVNPKPPVGFLDIPRCSMTGKLYQKEREARPILLIFRSLYKLVPPIPCTVINDHHKSACSYYICM